MNPNFELPNNQHYAIKQRAHELGVESVSVADIRLILLATEQVREQERVFRSLLKDLQRVCEQSMTWGDKARDLMLSYDIKIKPKADG